jgi:hypothetical protein
MILEMNVFMNVVQKFMNGIRTEARKWLHRPRLVQPRPQVLVQRLAPVVSSLSRTSAYFIRDSLYKTKRGLGNNSTAGGGRRLILVEGLLHPEEVALTGVAQHALGEVQIFRPDNTTSRDL